MQRNLDAIREQYRARIGLLDQLAQSLDTELRSSLSDVHNIDRIYFRTKGVESFVEKAATRSDDDKDWKYQHPLEEIEDQVAGRILVLYRSDIKAVLTALNGRIRQAEREHRKPSSAKEFDYETTHMICLITPDLVSREWSALADPPQTFELQIRTLAQHAWSEPQHGFYKTKTGLTPESLRKLYWAAASAWGLDSIWEDLRNELDKLHTKDS